MAREATVVAREAAAAGLAHWAKDLATWSQHRLQVADTQEYEARGHADVAHAWQMKLRESIAGVCAERDRLHEVCACLEAKEDELMLRESALGLAPERPPLPYPLFDTNSPGSIYSTMPASPPPEDDSDPLA